MERKGQAKDLIVGTEYIKAVLSPRAILTWDKKIALVEYRDTKWFGLPGGKVNMDEADGNLLDAGAFTTLVREVQEECEVDIQFLENELRFLGLTEVTSIYQTKRKAVYSIAPVFVVLLDDKHGEIIEKLEQDTCPLSIDNPGEVLVLPDARMAIHFFLARKGSPGGFLSDKMYYFQMEPKMGLLSQRPAWLRKSLNPAFCSFTQPEVE